MAINTAYLYKSLIKKKVSYGQFLYIIVKRDRITGYSINFFQNIKIMNVHNIVIIVIFSNVQKS